MLKTAESAEARPPIAVDLHFHENGAPIPIDPEPFHPIRNGETLSGSGQYLGSTLSGSGLSARFSTFPLLFSGPGVYHFELPKVPGYRALEPLRIEVGERSGEVIEIELVPEP